MKPQMKIVSKSEAVTSNAPVIELTEARSGLHIRLAHLGSRAFRAIARLVSICFVKLAQLFAFNALIFAGVCGVFALVSYVWIEARTVMIETANAATSRVAASLGYYPPAPLIAGEAAPTLNEIIDAAADKNGVHPDLVRAVIVKESKGKLYATSPGEDGEKNARGLMQVRTQWVKKLGLDHWSQLYDPATNIDAGSWILAANLKESRGDVERALMVYRAGPKPDPKHCDEACARAYAREVLNIFAGRRFDKVNFNQTEG